MILRVILVLFALAPLSFSAGEESPLPARVERLDAHPARVVLADRHAYAQLVLSAHLEGGDVVDATRRAELESVPDFLDLGPTGLLRPRADGEGVLRYALDGVTVEIPVLVTGQGVASDPSFVRDVMPRISRLGCNLGTCHGADKGKNGFKLSLRGYDPRFDHTALTDDLSGRRFDRVDPERSLFLLKPSGAVPHEGGRRLDPETRDFELFRDWVASGASFDADATRAVSIRIVPEQPTIPRADMGQQFAVLASYADGTERDVTAHAFFESSDIEVTAVDEAGLVTALRRGESAILARYEGRYAATTTVVMGDREGFAWREVETYNWIDELVHEKLRFVRTSPGELCTDEEFLRRVHLDLTGRAPAPRETRTFLLDRRDSRAKREEMIDRLIGSAAFVEHWTSKWCDLLQVNPKFLGDLGAERLRDWVRASVASNQPYDSFVRDVLTASGSTLENPAAGYYRVLREPDVAMENTTQLFLGVRFNCNKCHDHPFERWTQDQHWELAAWFAQVVREGATKNEEQIKDGATGTVESPRTNAPVSPHFPYEHAGAVPSEGPLRARLAAWLTAPENPYFARSYANRVWSYFLGRGLIEPVDDIRASNPPSNPALLDRLTVELIDSGFDVRALMRTICRSRTYQLSVRSDEWNIDDRVNYSHALARRLPAEVLYDALHEATGSRRRLPGLRVGTHAVGLADPRVETRDGFLSLFGRPPRESACECERASGISLGQALSLVNGPTVAEAIHDPRNALVDLVAIERDPARLVEELYLSFLCRFPTPDETARLAPSVDPRNADNRVALDPAGRAELERRYAEWERAVPLVSWHPTAVRSARSSAGTTLELGAAGAVLTTGTSPVTDTTTIVLWTDASRLTGLRLEALPHESLPGKGPGRSENGNFVLNHVAVVLIPAADPSAAHALAFGQATADFSQQGWDVKGAVDDNPTSGWAVMPRFGQRHEAVFALAEPVDTAGGAVLVVTLEQQHGTQHTLGHFRLSVTDTPDPRASDLPDPVLAALALPAAERAPEDVDVLLGHYLGTDGEMRDRIRLAATRDLAWALANSPAFLFNR